MVSVTAYVVFLDKNYDSLAREYSDEVMGCDAMRFCYKILLINFEC
jgi:hypothetical protein